MKLKNRRNDNWFYYEDCVMRGEIEMTENEWKEVRTFLYIEFKKSVKNCDTDIRDGLASDFMPKIPVRNLINVGITGTRLIVAEYNLKKYKEVNYLIRIKK